jgi:hypothetical protein
MIHGSQVRVGTPAFPRIVRPSTINIVRVFGIECVLELFGLFKVELLFMLEVYENEIWAKKLWLFTAGIETHSLLSSLLISPVLIA